ncbi:MAG: glycosyltransferase family 4 protein [Clostridia bacterium]|nr:glycosyltransferase family 4 protein [Clostridia bacterium]
MKIYEIGTGYTPIPAQMGAATEIVVEELTEAFLKAQENVEILDIASAHRASHNLPITEIKVPAVFTRKDVSLGILHKMKRVVYSLALASQLKKILKNSTEKVILHFHNQYNLFFFLKTVPKKYRQKAVIAYTVHSYIWGTRWEEIESTIKKKYFQEVFCVQNADLVLVLNDITIDHLTQRFGVDRDRIVKTINGVNTDKYSPLSAYETEKFKAENGLQNKKVIFQVGSVCDRKNQLGSVQMLLPYLRKNPDVVFMYAGGVIDEEYKLSIDKLATENGIEAQVRYAGELAPGKVLNQYYNMAHCSVFTSKLESFGLVIIEAISAGTPVILSNSLMFDLHKGYSIYNSDEEFISLVDKTLNTEKSAVSDRTEVLEKYSWNSVAADHLHHFKNLLN